MEIKLINRFETYNEMKSFIANCNVKISDKFIADEENIAACKNTKEDRNRYMFYVVVIGKFITDIYRFDSQYSNNVDMLKERKVS